MSGSCKCPPPENGYGCDCNDQLMYNLGGANVSDVQSSHNDHEQYYSIQPRNPGAIKINSVQYMSAIPGEIFSVFIHLDNNLILPFNVEVNTSGHVHVVGPQK